MYGQSKNVVIIWSGSGWQGGEGGGGGYTHTGHLWKNPHPSGLEYYNFLRWRYGGDMAWKIGSSK